MTPHGEESIYDHLVQTDSPVCHIERNVFERNGRRGTEAPTSTRRQRRTTLLLPNPLLPQVRLAHVNRHTCRARSLG